MDDQPIEPSEPAEPIEPPAKGPRVRRVVALAVAVVLVAAASATAGYLWVLRGSDEALTSKVPAGADMFMTVYLDPSAAQKANLDRIVGEFPALGSGDALSGNVNAALDDALTSFGLGSEDVRPWLGSQVGMMAAFPSSPFDTESPVAFLIDVSDESKAEVALAKVRSAGSRWSSEEREGVAIWTGWGPDASPMSLALVDGTVVLGSTTGAVEDIVDTARGETASLAESRNFVDTIAPLPLDRLALVYIDFPGVLDLLESSGGFTAAQLGAPDSASLEAVEGVALSLSAHPKGIALDMTVAMDTTKLSDEERASLAEPESINSLLSWVPQDAYLVETQASIDELVKPLIEQLSQDPQAARGMDRFGLTGPNGLIEHLTGELVLEAGPGTLKPYPGGAVLIGTDDASSMEATFGRLEKPVAKSFEQPKVWIDEKGNFHVKMVPRPEWQTREHDGVTIHFLPVRDTAEAGVAVSYAVTDEVGIIASSPEEVERLLDTHAGGTPITEAPGFIAATEQVGGPEGGILYVDVAAIVTAVRDALPESERASFDLVEGGNLRPLKSVAIGGSSDETHSTVRIFIVIA